MIAHMLKRHSMKEQRKKLSSRTQMLLEEIIKKPKKTSVHIKIQRKKFSLVKNYNTFVFLFSTAKHQLIQLEYFTIYYFTGYSEMG